MNTTTRKTIALLLTASMATTVFGCSKDSDSKKKNDVEADVQAVVEDYMSYLVAGKADKAAKLVIDGEDVITAATEDLSDDELAVYEAMLDYVTYEVSDADGNDKKGSATVTISYPEVSVDDCASIDDVIDLLEDADLCEDEIEISLKYVDDELLIEADSATDVVELLVEEATNNEYEFTSEPDGSDAMVVFEAYMNCLMDGDFMGADAYTMDQSDPPENFDLMAEIFETYFAGMDYEAEIFELTDEGAAIYVSGTAPDYEGACEDINNHDVLVALVAEFMDMQFNGADEAVVQATVMSIFVDTIVNGMDSRSDVPFEGIVYMGIDSEGNYLVDDASALTPSAPDMDFMDNVPEDEQVVIMTESIELLHNQGRMTDEDYEMVMSMLALDGSDVPVTPDTPSATIGGDITLIGESGTYYEGESADIFTFQYENEDGFISINDISAGDPSIICHETTWAYYDVGSTFDYEVYLNGELVSQSQSVIGEDNDEVYMEYTPAGGIEAGNYAFVLRDQGEDTIHSIYYLTVE